VADMVKTRDRWGFAAENRLEACRGFRIAVTHQPANGNRQQQDCPHARHVARQMPFFAHVARGRDKGLRPGRDCTYARYAPVWPSPKGPKRVVFSPGPSGNRQDKSVGDTRPYSASWPGAVFSLLGEGTRRRGGNREQAGAAVSMLVAMAGPVGAAN